MSEITVNRKITPAMHALYMALTAAGVITLGTVLGFVGGANRGYAGLVRPMFMPPDLTFSIVWPALYALMGASLYLTIATHPESRDTAAARTLSIVLFCVQLAINVCWPIVFFRLKALFLAFVWLAVLDAIVVALVVIDFRVNKLSAALMLPYLGWIIFATILNVMMAVYN